MVSKKVENNPFTVATNKNSININQGKTLPENLTLDVKDLWDTNFKIRKKLERILEDRKLSSAAVYGLGEQIREQSSSLIHCDLHESSRVTKTTE